MPDFRRGGKSRPNVPKMILLIALYAVILAAVILVAGRLDMKKQPEAVYGSLDGRFVSDIVLETDENTYYYRENEILNYLLIGVDREELDPADHQTGGQADFLVILSIDRRNRTITPVMIDRDTMADVDTYGIFGNPAGTRTMQICLAQAFSGSDITGSRNTASAVEDLLHGVKMDRYLLMDISGINILNEAVGGVEVTLTDDLTALDPSLEKGATVRLEGDMAEHFVRGRTTVADGTNVSRMNRQRVYMDSLMKTIYARLDEDSGFMGGVIDALGKHLESDADESVLLSDINAYSGYQWKNLILLPGTHRLGDDGFMQYWPKEAELTRILTDIWFEAN